MNLDHYKDPNEFVSESASFARRQLQEKFQMPDWAIDLLVLNVEDDRNHVTYGCAGLSHTKWDSMPDPGYLLLKVVAAGSAYLNGPESWRRASRFEFERVYQQWKNFNDDNIRQSFRGRVTSKNISDRHKTWLEKARELVRSGMEHHNVAAAIAKMKDINPKGIQNNQIRKVLKKNGFYPPKK